MSVPFAPSSATGRLGGHVGTVGAGMVLTGLGTYVFLAVAGQRMTTSDFAAFSAGWSVLLTAGAGLFIPLEIETSRRLIARRGSADPVAWATRLGVGLTLAVTAATGLAWQPLMHLLDGDELAVAALPLLCAANSALMPLRGRAAAAGRFGAYASSLVIEAAVRCAVAGAVLIGGHGSPGVVLLALPIAALLAAAVVRGSAASGVADSTRRLGNDTVTRPHRPSDVAGLIIGSVLAQALLNLPPVLIKALDGAGDLAGPVLAGLSLARIPLFLSPALIAPLLPRLAGLHERGDHGRVAQVAGTVLAIVALAALASSALALPLGRPVTGLVFGRDLALSGGQVAILVLGAMAFLTGQFSSSVLVAVQQHGWVGFGWAAGLAVFGATWAVVDDPVLGAEWGLVTGAAAAASVFVGALILTRPSDAPAYRR